MRSKPTTALSASFALARK
jgi:hypothetical protein